MSGAAQARAFLPGAASGRRLTAEFTIQAGLWEIPMYATFDEKGAAGIHLMVRVARSGCGKDWLGVPLPPFAGVRD